MQYELFYLIGASKEAELEKIKKEAEEIVTKVGGQFLEKTTLEKRRLSYAVKHETHGIYIARRFELEENENLKDIIAKLNLNSSILRFLISKADELPELKSKEERMSEVARKEVQTRPPREEKKPPIREEIKKEKAEETGDAKNEDIDKKLEEILNI